MLATDSTPPQRVPLSRNNLVFQNKVVSQIDEDIDNVQKGLAKLNEYVIAHNQYVTNNFNVIIAKVNETAEEVKALKGALEVHHKALTNQNALLLLTMERVAQMDGRVSGLEVAQIENAIDAKDV